MPSAQHVCRSRQLLSPPGLGVEIDPGDIPAGDILVDHVDRPDPAVWGLSGRELVRTFGMD